MDGYDDDFIEFFWTYYPKKVGKFNAQKEWRKRNLTPGRKETIKQHLIKRVKEDTRWLPNEKGSTFIVDPERFLKDRRDEDQYERRYTASSKAAHQDFKPEPVHEPANPEIAKAALARLREQLH